MKSRRRVFAVSLLFLAAASLAACGGGEDGETQPEDTPAPQQTAAQATSTEVAVTARDYTFDVPATFKGGLVKLSYVNQGKEPHFASFAKIAPGKTIDDVRALFNAPPSAGPPPGPPPFQDYAGFPTADPGFTGGSATVNLPAGSYALFCAIPSPDGQPHTAKGMLIPVTVTQGTDGELPAAVGTVNALDFSFAPMPPLKEGKNVVRLSNKGKQAHELNLVELQSGKKVDDIVKWLSQDQPTGPPPARFLSGVFVASGTDGTAELDLKKGSNYAFVCAIPDTLGDFKPHVAKGMYTGSFTVS